MDKLLEQSSALNILLEALEDEQYDKQAHALVSKLNKISSQDLASTKDELDTLSVSTHTILYLHILSASIDASAASGKAAPRQLPAAVLPEGLLWPYIVQLLLECDRVQIRFCGTQFLKVIDCVALGAEQTLNYVPAIQLIHHVILRLDETSSTLTSTHRTFVRLCLLAQAYAEALDILDRPIYHIPTQQQDFQGTKEMCSASQPTWKYLSPMTGLTHPISSRTYMEYYLLGGMCYMAMRRYRDAFFFLEVVLSTPTLQNVASSIMIEAYKKWLLVGLVLDGVAPTAPKNASQAAMRHIRAIAKPYECVADAFKTNNIERLRVEIEAGHAFWQEDGNYGLMVELFQSFQKFSILRMGKTFDALSIAEIARRTSPFPNNTDETKAYLEALIVSGELGAVIMGTDKGEVLRFLPASQKSEAQVETVLASQTRELGVFLAHIQNTEHRMAVTKEYIDFLKKLKKIKDEDKKNATTNGARSDDVDEDMMEEY